MKFSLDVESEPGIIINTIERFQVVIMHSDERSKQIEQLVRMGMMPVQYLPWLNMALQGVDTDAFLPLNQRRVFYDFTQKIMNLVFDDPQMYRLLRQRVAMKKFEEFNPIAEEEMDLKRTPEGMLDTLARSAERKKKAGGKISPAEKRLASRAKTELRRRRDNLKGRMEEQVQPVVTSESYEKAFLETLKTFNVSSVADLPKENVKEFFNTVEQLYNSGE